MYQPLQMVRLYEQMAEQIKERILNNELKAGDRLPNERELSDQFGVSRTVVREAVKSLEKDGLIEVQPGRGTFVAAEPQKALRNSITTLLRLERAEDWRNLIDVRELLEPGISSLAAERATAEDIWELEKAVETMDRAMQDAQVYIQADNAFHLALATATHNDLLVSLVAPIVGLLTAQRMKIFNTGDGPRRGQEHHRQILAAVRMRDAPRARLAMLAHLEQIREDSRLG